MSRQILLPGEILWLGIFLVRELDLGAVHETIPGLKQSIGDQVHEVGRFAPG
jgi:hypothetical protein